MSPFGSTTALAMSMGVLFTSAVFVDGYDPRMTPTEGGHRTILVFGFIEVLVRMLGLSSCIKKAQAINEP